MDRTRGRVGRERERQTDRQTDRKREGKFPKTRKDMGFYEEKGIPGGSRIKRGF